MNLLAKALIKEMIYKALPVGTIRDWKGGKYKKTESGKWIKVSTGEQKKPKKEVPNKTWDEATKEDIKILADRNIEKFKNQEFDKEFRDTFDYFSRKVRDIKERGGIKENPTEIGDKLDYYIMLEYKKMKPIYEQKQKEFIKRLKEGQK